jgi:hypothetical protein
VELRGIAQVLLEQTLSVLNLHPRSVSELCRVTKENTVGRKGSSFADSRPSAPRVGLKSNSALYIWQGLALADDPLQWRGRARGNENVSHPTELS